MPIVVFLQDKPRTAAKIGGLLKKKGFEVSETTYQPDFRFTTKPDIVVLDVKLDDVRPTELVKAIKSGHGDIPVIVLTADAHASDTEQSGAIFTTPGKIVDSLTQLWEKLKGAVQAQAPSLSAAPEPEGAPLEKIIAGKIDKVRELRKAGVDPFPPRFSKADLVARIRELGEPLANEQHSGKKITTAGRVMQLRLMGKAAFFHLQDGSGKAQSYIRLDSIGEKEFNFFRDSVAIGDFVGVSGEVFKTKTGEPTLAVEKFTLLAKALRPLPEKWHGLKDTEERYRNRHLDLISNAEVRELFAKRSKIVESLRATFHRLGYMEVDTPILLTQAGGASATPFKTHHNALDADMVLRIATELPLKRLIIGGLEKVYEMGRIFRNEGIDTRHNPEFTTVEAYAAYSDYHGMAELVEAIFGDLCDALKIDSIDYRGEKLSLKPPFKRLYMPELWKEKCGEDIHKILKGKSFDRQGLMALAARLHIDAGPETPSAKVFERIFDGRILPELVQPAFVLDHPTAITPLAKCKPGDESLVERFEFFVGTDELANAYTELNDPLDQRERLQEQMRQRQDEKNEEADILDEEFVQAMEAGMPPTGGIGIGVDRLCMVLTGHPSIREIILFPTLKPG